MTSVEDMLWKGWGKMLVRDTSAYKNKYTWVFFTITCIFKCGGISFLTFQSSDRPPYQLRWEEKERFFLIIHEQIICMAQTNESASICLGKKIKSSQRGGLIWRASLFLSAEIIWARQTSGSDKEDWRTGQRVATSSSADVRIPFSN